MSEFFQRLKTAMNLRNISQADLCRITNIPKSAMSQYLSGKFKPKQTRTYLIAKALDVNEAWLMGFDDVPMDPVSKPTEEHQESKLTDDDIELQQYLEELKNREEMRMLFSLTKNATKEDVMQAVKIIEALKKDD